MGKKIHDECCERFLKKKNACKDCPLMAALSKKKRRKLLKLSCKMRRLVEAA